MTKKHPNYCKMSIDIASVMGRYVTYLQGKLNTDERRARNRQLGHHDFIPSYGVCELHTTLSILKDKLRESPNHIYFPKFLDAGCGIGNIMLLARHIGFDAEGIEYDEDLTDMARTLTKCRVHNGDISTYTQYHKYHVIFYYVPIRDGKKMDKFCEVLARGMRIGSYVIPNGRTGPFYRNKGFKRVCDILIPTFKKIGKYQPKESV